jgi:predicted small lipoprotein YifL
MSRLALLILTLISVAACGKKGPLLYPDMLIPAAPREVFAVQSGDGIKLSFLLPGHDKAGRKLTDLAGVTISRRELPAGQTSCNACSSDFRMLKRLYLDVNDGGPVQRFGNRIVMLDADVRIGSNYTYRVTPFTPEGDGEPSIPVQAELSQPVPAPALRVYPAPTEIRLEFAMPSPAEGTLVGFNLYRAPKGEVMSYLPLNREPLPVAGGHIDSGLERDLVYRYCARALVRMPSGAYVEGFPSAEVEAMLKNEEE